MVIFDVHVVYYPAIKYSLAHFSISLSFHVTSICSFSAFLYSTTFLAENSTSLGGFGTLGGNSCYEDGSKNAPKRAFFEPFYRAIDCTLLTVYSPLLVADDSSVVDSSAVGTGTSGSATGGSVTTGSGSGSVPSDSSGVVVAVGSETAGSESIPGGVVVAVLVAFVLGVVVAVSSV